jgi:cold shock CspA family protein
LPDVRGTVTAFDRVVGLGEITRDDGRVVPFHCIVIADGSRDIPVGAEVEFDLMGKLGRYEADHVVTL